MRMSVCLHGCVRSTMYAVLQSLEEGVKHPGAGGAGGCDLPNIGAGTQTGAVSKSKGCF